MLKKQCLLYFSILIFKYIFFARHIALGLTQQTSFPLTKRFPVAFKIYLGLCFLANLWSQGNLSVLGTEPLTAFQNMSPPLVKEIHYHQQVAYKCRPAAFVSRQICGAATQV